MNHLQADSQQVIFQVGAQLIVSGCAGAVREDVSDRSLDRLVQQGFAFLTARALKKQNQCGKGVKRSNTSGGIRFALGHEDAELGVALEIAFASQLA